MISRRSLLPVATLARAADFPELLNRVTLHRVSYAGLEFVNTKEARARIQDTGVRFYGPHVGPRFLIEAPRRAYRNHESEFATAGAGVPALRLRDFRAGKQAPLGQDEFDCRALAAAIRKTNWTGWLTLEEESLKSDTACIKTFGA